MTTTWNKIQKATFPFFPVLGSGWKQQGNILTHTSVGGINLVTLINAGSGYSVGDVLTDAGGAVFTLTAVDGFGAITSLTITKPSTGYSQGSPITPGGGTGSAARFIASTDVLMYSGNLTTSGTYTYSWSTTGVPMNFNFGNGSNGTTDVTTGTVTWIPFDASFIPSNEVVVFTPNSTGETFSNFSLVQATPTLSSQLIGWTNIPKPIGTSSIITQQFVGGVPIGMLLALTASSIIGTTSIVTSNWTKIPKATSTSWTAVPKAT